MESPLWTDGASPWPHEREALAFVRARLPNFEPYRAWTNVEFIAEDGSVNEVDLLVVTPKGLFLVEIKSWPGMLRGSGQLWTNRRPDGREFTMDHPLLLANRNAKRLRSILARQRAVAKEHVPWVTALIFLSSPELECHLDTVAAAGVCGRDQDPARPAPAPGTNLPGIVDALKDPATIGLRGQMINRPLSAKLAEALAQAGVRPSNRGRRAGDWLLGDLLDEGPGWQDFLATRPDVTATRRVRIYLSAAATTAEDEQRLRAAAEREFRMVQDVRHEGIARPLDLVQTERGPALFFDRTAGEERLDLWATAHLPSIPLEGRLELVRQLAEALLHAHSQRVTHRALSARNVVVHPARSATGTPTLVIGHWQAGARELATRLTAVGGEAGATLADRLTEGEQVYLAPETFTAEHPDAIALDTFSLGALGYLLLSGKPPAADLVERDAALVAHGGLALEAAVDGLPESVGVLVTLATDPVPAQRPALRELLDLLDQALDEATAPPPDELPDERPALDPLQAHTGAGLGDGWQVIRRLGSGSTALGLLCTRAGDSSPSVLKVARDESYAERLLDEARTLGRLRHSGIVECHGITKVGGRTALQLACAGDPDDPSGMTLADRLAAGGRLNPDLLERFGDDLLETVAFLEGMGIAHRDIKPDNLGVRPRPADRSLHLVLFDFTLSTTPDTNLNAGTPGYLDPFLAERPARRWDAAAERYAVAVTLCEMATGTRPVWGDGATDPLHLPDTEPTLDATLFDPAIRDDLTAFLARALHRQPGRRFDTAEDMRRAWRGVLAGARRSTTSLPTDAAEEATLERLAEAATPQTPVAELGLSGAAVGALERLGIGTVGQLLEYPTADWYRTPGTGLRVRKEVAEAVARLRNRADAPPAEPEASIDRIVRGLVAQPSTPQSRRDQRPVETLLGLSWPGAEAPQLVLDPAPAGVGPTAWPGPGDLKTHCGLARAAYDAMLDRARARWLKDPKLTQVRADMVAILQRAGGILSGDELAMVLRVQRGSADPGPMLLPRARAVVRAALEAEAGRSSNRFTWRRLAGGGSCVVALRTEALDGEELADYAAMLGSRADRLAASDPLLGPSVVVQELRAVGTVNGLPPLSDHRLVRLAAAASATAAVSSRLELYPSGMPTDRALRLARTALLVPGTLPVDDLRSRVRTRFPDAAPLPDRPELDDLVREAVGLSWHEGGQDEAGMPRPPGYRIPRPAAVASSLTASGTRFATGVTANVVESERTIAANTADRLRRHAANGGYLVLTVSTRRHEQAIDDLASFGPKVLSVERLLIERLHQVAAVKGADWERAILAADAAGPAGPNWLRLMAPVREALALVHSDITAAGKHVLLTYPGLLGRYDALGGLDVLRDGIYRRTPAQALETLWVLVPSDDPRGVPTIGGRAVPYTASTEWLALPEAWHRNVHRTHQPRGAA